MDDMYRRARRYSAGRTVLDTLALVFLLCSIAFWGVLHWQVLVTPGGGVPQMIVAAVMTLVYSLALPVLLSALVPSTPAGQLLQKTQWATIGFWVIIPSVTFLVWHAYNLMASWFAAQPTIADAGLARMYTISALIAFVVIVALAMTQVSPERWIREVEQAHAVRKLELMQKGELAIVKARLLWAEQKALVGYARLLPAEQKEVIDTMRGLLMGIGDTQRSIARTLGIQGDIERSIMGDADIADTLDYVSQQLERPATSIDKALTSIHDGDRENPHRAEFADEGAHVNTRLEPSIPRDAPDATRRHMTTGDDAYARAARQAFGVTPWTLKRLAEALDIGETRARELRDEWLASGQAREARLGRWYLTE